MRPEFHSSPGIAHQVGIALRVALRALRRRLRGEHVPDCRDAEYRAGLEPWVASLPRDALATHAFLRMPATKPPWVDTGVDLAAGDTFTLLADGRVYLSKLLDIWVPPWFQIWCRVGDAGPIFRGTRNLQSFTATSAGRLWLANYFPGEWSDRTGTLAALVCSGHHRIPAYRPAAGASDASTSRTRLAPPAYVRAAACTSAAVRAFTRST